MKTEVQVRFKREAEEEMVELVSWEVAKLLQLLPIKTVDLEYVVVEKRKVESWQTLFELHREPEGG